MPTSNTPLTSRQQMLIGQGPTLPFSFSRDTGGRKTGTGLEKIQASIYMVLASGFGDVFGLPGFGSRVPEFIFEPVIYADRLAVEVRSAVKRWIPEIELLDVNVFLGQATQGLVWVSGTFRVRTSPAPGSFVFPFSTGPQPAT